MAEFLAATYTHSSLQQWTERALDGEIVIEGVAVGPKHPLKPGQTLIWDRPPWEEPEAPLDFSLLYEDADLMAVSKPSGLPTLPGGGFLQHTLLHQVRKIAPDASPMHRLGRGTSGVVLFARSKAAAKDIQQQWRRPGQVKKTYLALLNGHPTPSAHTETTPIGSLPDPVLGTLFAASPDGKPSCSHFKVLERRETSSLCAVTIETGRPHQIRIHSAAWGYPLTGDPLYGPGGVRLAGSKAVPGDLGYALHAWSLQLVHPIRRQPLHLVAPPPAHLSPPDETRP